MLGYMICMCPVLVDTTNLPRPLYNFTFLLTVHESTVVLHILPDI